MQSPSRNWISTLSASAVDISPAQMARLRQRLAGEALPPRVALALRLVALRRALEGQAEPAPLKVVAPVNEPIAPAAPEDAATIPEVKPDPVPDPTPVPAALVETAPEAPPVVAPPKKRKKASFSAVSLDDAAGLLSAFGGLSADTPEAEGPNAPPDPVEAGTAAAPIEPPEANTTKSVAKKDQSDV